MSTTSSDRNQSKSYFQGDQTFPLQPLHRPQKFLLIIRTPIPTGGLGIKFGILLNKNNFNETYVEGKNSWRASGHLFHTLYIN